ncbi:hypothetical protein DEU42_113177, partial [Flavobacterium sp. AG291]
KYAAKPGFLALPTQQADPIEAAGCRTRRGEGGR